MDIIHIITQSTRYKKSAGFGMVYASLAHYLDGTILRSLYQ